MRSVYIIAILGVLVLFALPLLLKHLRTTEALAQEWTKQRALKCQRWEDTAFANMQRKDYGGQWAAAMQGWKPYSAGSSAGQKPRWSAPAAATARASSGCSTPKIWVRVRILSAV